ncbi:unnamed protein product [Linum trigynum]|uniref:Uncharacterized protein n=1 Tax=Linum trigynum TaxID=586398 RepID=A0AAV2CCI6_9ROSI
MSATTPTSTIGTHRGAPEQKVEENLAPLHHSGWSLKAPYTPKPAAEFGTKSQLLHRLSKNFKSKLSS